MKKSTGYNTKLKFTHKWYGLVSMMAGIFLGTLFLSSIISHFFISNFGEKDSPVIVATFVQGIISTVAAGFVGYQLRKDVSVEKERRNIEEAEFILNYNNALIQNEGMLHVEQKLSEWLMQPFQDETTDPMLQATTPTMRMNIINYLVYIEGLAPLVFNNVLDLDHIDDLIAYRVFVALNNKYVQQKHLKEFPQYYHGCFGLYKKWKKYREDNCLEILLSDDSLDKWEHFDYFANKRIKIRTLTDYDNWSDQGVNIARYIAKKFYKQKVFIKEANMTRKQNRRGLKAFYSLINAKNKGKPSSSFTKKRIKHRTINKYLTEDHSLLNYNNVRLACLDNKVIGVIVVKDNITPPEIVELSKNKEIKSLFTSDFASNAFIAGTEEKNQYTFIAHISINKKHSNECIENILLTQAIKEYGCNNIIINLPQNISAFTPEQIHKFDFKLIKDLHSTYIRKFDNPLRNWQSKKSIIRERSRMINNNVKVSRIQVDSMTITKWSAIADLIYYTDYDIYTDFFGSETIARKIIPNMIKRQGGLFSYENIQIAEKDGEIVGIIVYTHNKSFDLGLTKDELQMLPKSFESVKPYFDGLASEYGDRSDIVYGACICVKSDRHREGIAALLLHHFIEEHRSINDIYVDVVATNQGCINLCTNIKYGFGFEIIKTFQDYAEGGTELICKTLRRLKDNSKREIALSSTPRKDGFHMPGEFEPHNSCWMLWPERPDNWRLNANPAQKAFIKVVEAILIFEAVTIGVSKEQLDNAVNSLPKGVNVVEIPSNDAWARDTAPTFVRSKSGVVRAIDWKFNAYGGFEDGSYFPWGCDDRIAHEICEFERIDSYRTSKFVLEGGSIHTDGDGTLFTTEECLLSKGRNPHMTKTDIEDILKDYLGVEKVIWLKRGLYNDVTNGHVDNIMCVVKPGTVMLAWTDDKNDPQYEISVENLEILKNAEDAKGRKLEIIKMPLPKPTFITKEESEGLVSIDKSLPSREGERLSASYVNFYIANGGVVFPLFNDTNDKVAEEILCRAFPDRKIVGVCSREILLGGGNIHCITQQLPK